MLCWSYRVKISEGAAYGSRLFYLGLLLVSGFERVERL
jgi:hypothetical protein